MINPGRIDFPEKFASGVMVGIAPLFEASPIYSAVFVVTKWLQPDRSPGV